MEHSATQIPILFTDTDYYRLDCVASLSLCFCFSGHFLITRRMKHQFILNLTGLMSSGISVWMSQMITVLSTWAQKEAGESTPHNKINTESLTVILTIG